MDSQMAEWIGRLMRRLASLDDALFGGADVVEFPLGRKSATGINGWGLMSTESHSRSLRRGMISGMMSDFSVDDVLETFWADMFAFCRAKSVSHANFHSIETRRISTLDSIPLMDIQKCNVTTRASATFQCL
jgi:hypothetical protein